MQGSSIIPSARYRNAPAAIDWLCRVFGFTRNFVHENPDGTVAHAQLTRGAGMFMLGSVKDGDLAHHLTTLDATGGCETVGLCLVADDTEAVYAKAKAANAEIVQELSSPPYGGRSFACRDLEGHIWWVGSYDPWANHTPQPPRPLDL